MVAFSGWFGPVTGEGSIALAGGAGVTPVAIDASIDVITSPKVRVMGMVSPRRIQWAGSFGFSYVTENDGAGSPQEFVVYERIMNFEYMDISLIDFQLNGNQATNIWYKLPFGISWFIGAWF